MTSKPSQTLIAILAVLIIIAGVGGYFAGSSAVPPPKTVTSVVTQTVTTTVAAATVTVTTTVTQPPQTVTVTVTATPTPPITLPPPEAIQIKIGLLFPLTGAWAPLGTDQMTGARIAIDMINEQGGVLGRYKVSYVIADCKSDVAVAAAEAERLITMDKVQIIVGSYASPLLLAASEVAEKYKTIYWEVGAITDSATLRGFKYLFRPMPIGGDFGFQSVLFIRDVVAKSLGKDVKDLKVAIIYEDGPYGTSVAKGNKLMADKLGIPVVLYEGYPTAATDLSSLIMKLKAVSPDIILHTGYYSDTVLFFRQAKELGLKFKAYIAHGAGGGLPATYQALGKDMEYMFNVDPPSPYLKYEALEPDVREALLKFIEKFKAERGYEPMTHAHMGFSHTWILLTKVLPQAIIKYGSVTPDTIRMAALEINVPEGGTTMGYGVKFAPPEAPEDTLLGKVGRVESPQLHVGQNVLSYPVVMQWREGRLLVVYPEKFAAAKAVVPLPPESPYAG
ncbi:MAG: ABC transporter substrate-binding protein [Sulfolobales archaeon]